MNFTHPSSHAPSVLQSTVPSVVPRLNRRDSHTSCLGADLISRSNIQNVPLVSSTGFRPFTTCFLRGFRSPGSKTSYLLGESLRGTSPNLPSGSSHFRFRILTPGVHVIDCESTTNYIKLLVYLYTWTFVINLWGFRCKEPVDLVFNFLSSDNGVGWRSLVSFLLFFNPCHCLFLVVLSILLFLSSIEP